MAADRRQKLPRRKGCGNAGYAVAEGETQGFGKESRIRVFVGGQPGARKARTVHVNGVDYGRAANAVGTFTAVVFDPGHLSLVKGSPEGRRRFLDAAKAVRKELYG